MATIELLEQKINALEAAVRAIQATQDPSTDLNKYPFGLQVASNIFQTIGQPITLIRSGTFKDTITLDNLDGDADKAYRLIIRTYHTLAHYLYLRFNNDASDNYKVNLHYFGKSADTAEHTYYQENLATFLKITHLSRTQHFADLLINAASGRERLLVGTDFAYTDFSNLDGFNATGLWTNTTDNLRSITIATGVITSGEYYLYKLYG